MPQGKERRELVESRRQLLLSQQGYESARRAWRLQAKIVTAMKSEDKERKANAIQMLVAAGTATKTDAPKMLHLAPAYSEFVDAMERAVEIRDEAESDLAIARHRLNTESLLLASYLPGLVLTMPGHDGVTP